MKEIFSKDLLAEYVDESWIDFLYPIFNLEVMGKVMNFLGQQEQLGKIILPGRDFIFRAFKETKYDDLKVVIYGQD